MSRALGRAVGLVLVVATVVAALGPAVPTARAASTTLYPALTGSFTGPGVVATGGNATYYINGTGGPAYGLNGTEIGSITWIAKVSGADLTGVAFSPNSSTLNGSGPAKTVLKVGKVAESLTLALTLNSTYQGTSKTRQFNLTVRVVVPYVVRARLVVPGATGVLGFDLTVALDGTPVGTVKVPAIVAGGSYNLTYDYASTGLGAGWHTFSISLPASGLVRFSGGTLEYSQSFYVVGAPPDYPLYVLVGVVVFFGVLFIFMTRVAARRRASTRR